MILVIGGSYQGKLEYVKREFGILEDDVFFCSADSTEIDMDKPAIYGLHKFSKAAVEKGENPREVLEEAIAEEHSEMIFICDDISSGIVPIDEVERRWREENGRMLISLANRCNRVIRVFCGMGMDIKEVKD